MVGVAITIALMNHTETPNKHSSGGGGGGFKDLCVFGFKISVLNTCHFHFQIWFYTNDIFRNAGIPEPYIQYTTVGTGAIEVISGMLGVSFTLKVTF